MAADTRGGSGGGDNRRAFLKSAAAAGGAAAVASTPPPGPSSPSQTSRACPSSRSARPDRKCPCSAWEQAGTSHPASSRPHSSPASATSTPPKPTKTETAERTLGEVLERTKMRKDVYLVTKNSRAKIGGPGAFAAYEKRLNASLERLRTDYVDCYYLHGVEGREIPLFSRSRRQGRLREAQEIGKDQVLRALSCHDRRLPEIVTAAAESGWIDQIMIQYNYRTMTTDSVRRALDAAAKANLAIVAMKTQGGAGSFREGTDAPKFKEFVEKGFKKQAAAIKTVFSDQRVHCVVSEMTNRDMLRQNMASSRDHALTLARPEAARGIPPGHRAPLLPRLRPPLRAGRRRSRRRRHPPLPPLPRGLRQAPARRELYQALSPEARNLATADLAAAQAACPHGLQVVELLHRADRELG